MFNNNYSTTEIEEEEDTIINHHQYLDTIDNEIEEEQEDSIYVAVVGVGMIARNQVSAEQVEIYMEQERNKRRQLLHKFIQSCSLSKVKVDTILIESDFVAKAILDLIPILQISNLVIGANKFHQRKARSKKGNGVADQVVQNAPENCKVRIICEGKEVNDEQMMMKTPSPKMIATANSANNVNNTKENDSVLCVCFKPKFK
ncbi:U-box domain-containing protein 54-like isoform X2 [Vicia villosa]|uniref:U-box domain-containing protein 54-like isoform X2 n=1 Tax=Vicia villosa TaxID=3911 RepID=UPI00273B8928|nr:U-box domain-containing protein 54-like isoform X2 [Vicia villosa]